MYRKCMMDERLIYMKVALTILVISIIAVVPVAFGVSDEVIQEYGLDPAEVRAKAESYGIDLDDYSDDQARSIAKQYGYTPEEGPYELDEEERRIRGRFGEGPGGGEEGPKIKIGAFLNGLLQSSAASGRSMFDLLYDQDELYEKRAEAMRKFRDMFGGGYLPGSTEFWIDSFCGAKIPKVGGGYAFVEVDEQIRVMAHVEGERQILTVYEEDNETAEVVSRDMYLYKLSFRIDNRDNRNQSLLFNVFVDNVNLFEENIKLSDGDSFARTGSSTIVQTSEILYSTICIKFINRDIFVRDGEDYEQISELCNAIVDNGYGVESIYYPPGYASIRRVPGSAPKGGAAGPTARGDGQNQAPRQI